MRKLRWSARAKRRLRDIAGFIAQSDPGRAQRTVERIGKAAVELTISAIGRPGRVPNTFEKRVLRSPYLLVYSLKTGSVFIIDIVHGARDWPDGRLPD